MCSTVGGAEAAQRGARASLQTLTPLRRAAPKAQFILGDAAGGDEGGATSPRRGGVIQEG